MPSNPAQIDTTIQIIAPENIAFTYRVAGPFRRLPAYLLDLMFRLLFMVLAMLLLSLMAVAIGGVSMALWLVLFFIVSWFYGGLFETFWNGQTPGKRLVGLRVLSTNGRPINGMQAVFRNLLREVDVLFLGIGFPVMALNRRFQRLGDLVCRTMVVIEERPWLVGVAALDDPRRISWPAICRPICRSRAAWRWPWRTMPNGVASSHHLGAGKWPRTWLSRS